MCRPEFGELRERPPSLKMGGFQSGPQWKMTGGGVELKITKKRKLLKVRYFGAAHVGKVEQTNVYFLKRGVFRCGPGRKSRVFRSGPGRKMGGFRAAHTRTALIWEYPSPSLPHTHRADQNEGKNINKWPLLDRQTHRQKRRNNEGKLINKWPLFDRQTYRKERKTKENSLKMTFVWQTRGVYSYMKVVYICAAQSLGSLRSGPSLKMGAFRATPQWKRRGGGWN